jgi:hypothetical protein
VPDRRSLLLLTASLLLMTGCVVPDSYGDSRYDAGHYGGPYARSYPSGGYYRGGYQPIEPDYGRRVYRQEPPPQSRQRAPDRPSAGIVQPRSFNPPPSIPGPAPYYSRCPNGGAPPCNNPKDDGQNGK